MKLLLKELRFYRGKWHGVFEFVFTRNENKKYTGTVSFVYDKAWHFRAFHYPMLIKEKEREVLKKEFFDIFDAKKIELESLFFVPREKYAERPIIDDFKIIEQKSNEERIHIIFTLKNISDDFTMVLNLIDNHWVYTLKSKDKSVADYKTFYAWEDAVFDAVNKEIGKDVAYRIRYIVHGKKYKYK